MSGGGRLLTHMNVLLSGSTNLIKKILCILDWEERE